MSFLLVPALVLLPLVPGLPGPKDATAVPEPCAEAHLVYRVDLTDPTDDMFHVTVDVGELDESDRYLDFVSYAPGVHSPLNFGRFVQTLRALDAEGNEVAVERLDTNRWELSEPTRVARILYDIEDSFDTELPDDRIMPACGSGIEPDFVLLNTHGVLAYFEHHLACPVELDVLRNPEWLVGTALDPDANGVYSAPTYRVLVDSPLLLGPEAGENGLGGLSSTAIWVGDMEVEIFVQSPVQGLNAEEVLFVAGEILEAAEHFIGFAPVDRYAFLMCFIGRESMTRNRFRSMGALEHSYSSVYSLPAVTNSLDGLARVIAHEFMHILTPLHLKSTIIAEFDYSIPTTDRHLWLYEGLTEWSADMLRLRGEVVDLERHLEVLSGKIRTTRAFEPAYSLGRLSAEWSTEAGLRQYGNIYQLGALTSAMLDIRLLELSGGERGLREVFFEFVQRYGKDNPFDDETFFDELVAATYPEIDGFIQDHILGDVPLPYEESFASLGIAYENGTLSVVENVSREEEALRDAWSGSLVAD